MFFVHIPKTAGTSFRKAAEDYFGTEYICYDYESHSNDTSDIVQNEIYDKRDMFSFAQLYAKSKKKFLSGHVNANKYIDMIGSRNTVVFLRDPVQRLISEYNHFVLHYGFKDSFKSFYSRPQFINRQSKILAGVPLQAIGFVGLTEKYVESLEQINALFKTDIKNITLNKGRDSIDKYYDLGFEQLSEVDELNKEDIDLYQKSVYLFKERFDLYQQNIEYIHGSIQQTNSKSLSGWAWSENNDDPIVVEIIYKGKVVGEVIARDLRPNLLRFSPPRSGYVGFHFVYPFELNETDKIICRVKSTKQIIT